jgi:predicted O-methyltransferase YrrM
VNQVKELGYKAYRKAYRLAQRLIYTQSVINQMRSSPDERIRLFARSIEAALHKRMNASEKECVSKIESVRTALLHSNEVMATGSRSVQADGVESVAQVCRSASKKMGWGLLFMKLIQAFQLSTCLELGTCLGISTAYQSSALTLNGEGNLISIEGSQARVAKARETLENLGLRNVDVMCGEFEDVLPRILSRVQQVDFAFVDGDHHLDSTLQNVSNILPHMSDGSLLVLDDISWSQGMVQAWEEVRKRERIEIAIDLYTVGLCLVGSSDQNTFYKLALW